MSPTSIALLGALIAVIGGLVAVFAGVSATRMRQPDAQRAGEGGGVDGAAQQTRSTDAAGGADGDGGVD